MTQGKVTINRAPVLTLWAAVVAERLGYERDAALTFGKAVAGLNAQGKGRTLGIYHSRPSADGSPPKKSGLGEDRWIEICSRPVPVKKTSAGLRAVVKDVPIEPDSVQTYLEKAFGADLGSVRTAMRSLAGSYEPKELNEIAFALYQKFRPAISAGQKGWGQKGVLDIARIRALADRD